MNTPFLETSTSVLTLDKHLGDQLAYAVFDPEMPERIRAVRIDTKTWVDMGQPREVTITIRPGDAINDGRLEHQASPVGVFLAKAAGTAIAILGFLLMIGLMVGLGTGLLLVLQFMLDLLAGR